MLDSPVMLDFSGPARWRAGSTNQSIEWQQLNFFSLNNIYTKQMKMMCKKLSIVLLFLNETLL